MSRSFRKAIIKQKTNQKNWYWKKVRSRIKQSVNRLKLDDSIIIPDQKEIVNNYDYCDYKFDYEYKAYKYPENKDWFEKSKKKYSRK